MHKNINIPPFDMFAKLTSYLRHSGFMHFSASVVSALHMDPSAGVILIILCLFFIPIPQLALHSSHSPHSVTRQLLGAVHNILAKDQSSGTYLTEDSHSAFRLIKCGRVHQILTTFFIYNAFLSFLCRHFAHGAILRELLHISLSRSHSHATRYTTRGPRYPLRHHACRAI